MSFRNVVVIIAVGTVLLGSAAGAATSSGTCEVGDKPTCEKMNVLFVVGGADFHDPVSLPPIVKKALEDTGKFTVTITEDRDQFKLENICNYDLVLIYTTGGELSKEQEKGLTEFVEGGKALVGIHSATDSFKNSDVYWKMLGGQFIGHGGGTFTVKITGKHHCIVKGMDSFDITDETYCHKFHPESEIVVLMRREEDGEPASWVQYYGRGRVFVTGLGHGKPAWDNPAFQETVVRGSLWATGRLNP